MNKKGQIFSVGAGFLWASLAIVIFLIVLFSGGFKTIIGISGFLASIPSWVYIGALILFFLKIVFGGKK